MFTSKVRGKQITWMFLLFRVYVKLLLCGLVGSQFEKPCECGVSTAGVSSRIVGGAPANPHEFPWVAAIMLDNKLHCGGAILTDRHILSAGHCVKWSDHTAMEVIAGLHDQSNKESVQVRPVELAIIHPQFTSTTVRDDNDIAILTLSQPLTFSEEVLPICMPGISISSTSKRSFLDIDDLQRGAGIIAGWGKQGVGRSGTKELNKARVRILPFSECAQTQISRHITPNMMCAYSSMSDGCQGDSGGPLVKEAADGKFVLIGIVSWGIGCANPIFPGVYTNVSKYIDWIQLNTMDGHACL